MKIHYRWAAAAALMALSATVCINNSNALDNSAQEYGAAAPTREAPDVSEQARSPGVAGQPTLTILSGVKGVLGMQVRSAADENMGRVVDIVVDRAGTVRAAIIDFGGFLGVGNRKIVVAWNALRFPVDGSKDQHIALEWTRDQVQAAPEFRDNKPVVVLGASVGVEPRPID